MSEEERFKDPRYIKEVNGKQKPPGGRLYETAEESYIERQLRLAEEAGLDLVEISPKAKPPVCKIMDYGKYKYEEKKKAQQARKKHQVIKVKELRMRPNIGEHDLENKLKMGRKFLSSGYKLKLSIVYRGREMSRQDLGDSLLEKIVLTLSEVAEKEKDNPLAGRKKSIILAPK